MSNNKSQLHLQRRDFLAAAAATAGSLASGALARDYGKNAPPVRYPDPDIVVLDDRFKKYALGNTPIQRIYHSNEMLWAEGPAWNGVGRYLLWSDIPQRCATALHGRRWPHLHAVPQPVWQQQRQHV